MKKVNFSDPTSLVAALRGQDALIITLAVGAPNEYEENLVRAAAEANVPWVMPNDYGIDPLNEVLGRESLVGARRTHIRDLIESVGKSSWTVLTCNFWYEFSLSWSPMNYGFDIPNRTVTFFDDGKTKIDTTTWEQCGRAVASLFSLKILPDHAGDESPCLSHFRNKPVYISSFLLSQRDMFDSVLRVTGTNEEDWTIRYQDVKERYAEGMAQVQRGYIPGFVQVLYSRVFYPDGSGNYSSRVPLHNELLGLPKEDLDERTAVAVKMAENDESTAYFKRMQGDASS